MIQKYPIMLSYEEDNESIKEVNQEELLVVLKYFKKDQSLGPNGWTVDFSLPSLICLAMIYLK